MIKLSLLIATMILSVKAFAVPGNFSEAVSNLNKFESAIGRPLSEDEAALLTKANYEVQRKGAVSLYCAGFEFNAYIKNSHAVCMSFQTGRVYELGLIGGGLAAGASAKIMRFVVRYDSSRYADSFDPIPGMYGAVSAGVVMPYLSAHTLIGESGNKSLYVNNIVNIGYILDFGSISAIVIR